MSALPARRHWRLWTMAGALGVAPALPAPAAPLHPHSTAQVNTALDAARRADAIGDPLQRCLAYPDLPQHQWPAGHAAALCAQVHARPITLETIRTHLGSGRLAQLDTAFGRDLERHFVPADASEIIHLDFSAIDASPAADELTRHWIERAPGSAYANAARARYLHLQAAALLGPSLMEALPAQQVATIERLSAQALDLLGRAIRLEPRLIHVHVELAELGFLIGRRDIVGAAHTHAAGLDSGCSALAQSKMAMLHQNGPAWAVMHDYAGELRAQQAQRPLLATAAGLPAYFEGKAFMAERKYKEAAVSLSKATRQGASTAALALLAEAMGSIPGHDRAERLQVLLQTGRFDGEELDTGLERGRALVRVGEYEWALRSLTRTLARHPNDSELHQMLALSNNYLERFSASEQHLLLAMKDPRARANALRLLVATVQLAGDWRKTAQYAAIMVREQHHPDGWRILGIARFRSGDKAGALQAFETLLSLVNPADAMVAPTVAWVQQAIAWIKAPDGAVTRPPQL